MYDLKSRTLQGEPYFARCTAEEVLFRNPRITNTMLKNSHVDRSELMSPVLVAFTIPTASNAAHTCDNAKYGGPWSFNCRQASRIALPNNATTMIPAGNPSSQHISRKILCGQLYNPAFGE